jgi:hypothetical protein
MKHELAQMLAGTTAHATVVVAGQPWRLYVFGVSRVGANTFVQIALIGTRNCTVTVRARGPIGNALAARRVLAVVRDWLQSGDADDQAYLDVSDVDEIAS